MAKVPPRLEKTLIHGCPGPLPDPALPEWADVGGRKLVKGPSNRWYQQQLIEWKPGEEPSQGGYYTSGHWRIPDEVKGGARAVEHWANKFGNPPLDATGSCCTAKPGDVLLRTEADLAKVVQERASAMAWQEDGAVDWQAFADSIRHGFYPVHVDNVVSVGKDLVWRLAKAIVPLVGPSTEHEAALLGEATRLAVTEAQRLINSNNSGGSGEDGPLVARQLTAERFLQGFLGSSSEKLGRWGEEEDAQLAWVQAVSRRS